MFLLYILQKNRNKLFSIKYLRQNHFCWEIWTIDKIRQRLDSPTKLTLTEFVCTFICNNLSLALFSLGIWQIYYYISEQETIPDVEIIEEIEIKDNNMPNNAGDLKEVDFLMKINSCASSPCLTDFLRSGIKQETSQTVYHPVSKLGTVPQLYLQIMSPRAYTESPVSSEKTKNLSRSDSESSTDSGVVFKVGFDDDDSVEADTEPCTCSQIRRNHTMPDMSVVSCIWKVLTLKSDQLLIKYPIHWVSAISLKCR